MGWWELGSTTVKVLGVGQMGSMNSLSRHVTLSNLNVWLLIMEGH